jgi:FkbM family methyltransferase
MIPASTRVPIIQGPSKGKKWIVGSSTHGCWLGSYENEQRSIFEKYVGSGDIVFDIGAHVGFFTLIASVLVGSSGKVVAFEPLPENLRYLHEHLSINHVDNVTVIEKAVSIHSGSVKFRKHANRAMGGISDDGELDVSAVSLDEMMEDTIVLPPSCIKMDVEGGEFLALRGGSYFLRRFHPIIFLSTHGPEIHKSCCRLLRQFGYDLISLDGREIEESTNILALDGT